MANRYATLNGASNISSEYTKITTGFDAVQAEMDAKPDSSIAQVNDVTFAADETLTVEGGTGITVTTNTSSKKVIITATGTSTPGAHGSSHNSDGSDPIPELTQVQEDLTAHLADITSRAINVKYPPTPMVGMIGDGVTDDSQAFINIITHANNNKFEVYLPNDAYLLNQVIDLTNLPKVVEPGAEDYSFRLVIRGEDVSKTILIGGVGLAKMFVYDPVDKINETRSFTFENLKIRSKDPFDDLTTRASLKAFELLACPHTYMRNIDMMGIDEGIHLQSCYFSYLENIQGSRMRRGIFIDGTSPDGTSYGFADACYLKDIRVGGWMNEWGLKILGSKGTKVQNFDSESGYTGNAVILQACHNIWFDTVYIENYTDAPTFSIGGNLTLNSLSDFCTNILIENGNIYNQLTRFIQFSDGVDGVIVRNCRFLFNYDAATPTTSQISNLYGFTRALGQGFGNYYKNISVLEKNEYYHKENYAEVFQEGSSSVFVTNEKSYLATGNISFYSPSYHKGMEVMQLAAGEDYNSFWVEEPGSYGTLVGVTATIASGSNQATFSDVSGVIPGTYLTIGSWQRVKVMAKKPGTNQVVLGENAPSAITDGAVSYANPVLRYNYKSTRWVSVPASATSTGSPGDIASDATHLYICHAANTWSRVAIATW